MLGKGLSSSFEHCLDWGWGLSEICPIYAHWESQCVLLLELPCICYLWAVCDLIPSVLSSGSVLPLATLPECLLTLSIRVFQVFLSTFFIPYPSAAPSNLRRALWPPSSQMSIYSLV